MSYDVRKNSDLINSSGQNSLAYKYKAKKDEFKVSF